MLIYAQNKTLQKYLDSFIVCLPVYHITENSSRKLHTGCFCNLIACSRGCGKTYMQANMHTYFSVTISRNQGVIMASGNGNKVKKVINKNDVPLQLNLGFMH